MFNQLSSSTNCHKNIDGLTHEPPGYRGCTSLSGFIVVFGGWGWGASSVSGTLEQPPPLILTSSWPSRVLKTQAT